MVDPWSGPTPQTNEYRRNEPNGIKKLLDRVDAVALAAKESTSNLLRTAGIRLTRLGMFIDSSLTVGGSLDVTGPMVVGGTLSLPAGIIGNASLTSPVKAQFIYFAVGGFALSTAGATFASSTITVPAGFTSAVVTVVGRVFAINPNTGYDYLSAVSKIDGLGGASLPVLCGGSFGSGMNISPYSTVLTGLSGGGTFVVAIAGNSNLANWAANASNGAEVSGTILWFR